MFTEFSSSKPNSKTKAPKASANAFVILVGENGNLSTEGKKLDAQLQGTIARALKAGKFSGKKGQFMSIIAPHGLDGYDRLLLAGYGKPSDFTASAAEVLGAGIVVQLNVAGVLSATLQLEEIKGAKGAAAQIAYGAALRDYRFDKYRTKEKQEDKPTLTSLTILTKGSKAAAKEFETYSAVVNAVHFSRNLVSEPANVIYPQSLADKCKELSKLGVEVEVLGEAQMKKLGMGALLGVGQGSENESKLVIMRWNGGKAKEAPLAFVGKGVTFDTGGISIKPAGGMEEMKWDMGGAAAVIGLMHALAGRKAKVNVVGVAGLVENMPDGKAQRPGDVVTSMSGQTIEVINTDAEGRLVLSDALWYTQDRFKPKLVIDLATLTGAIIISLGTSRAGLFSNNDKLADQLFKAGKDSGEELWRLPLGDVYDKQINSFIADMKNVGEGREAGSITAAQFLQRFIKEGTPWAHLDIAGTAWTNKDLNTCPKGATAFGVQLLNQFVKANYE